jgi:MoaA/NifB/PqqE/SkfB family radical SAM enzyme
MANIGYIQVVRHCNHFCGFCSNPTSAYVHTEESLQALVDDLVARDYYGVVLTGGEPTLHPELPSVVRYAKSKGLHVRMITNGSRMADPDFAARIAEAGLDLVHVSIYSVRPAVEEALRGMGGTLDKAFGAIEQAIRNGIPVNVNSVINKLNADHLDENIAYIIKHHPGVRHFVWNNLDPSMGRAEVNQDRYLHRMEDLRGSLYRALRLLHLSGRTFRVERVPLCFMPEFGWASTETRKIVKGEERLVHFLDAKQTVRQQSFEHVYAPTCHDCSVRNICGGLFERGEAYDPGELHALRIPMKPIVDQVINDPSDPSYAFRDYESWEADFLERIAALRALPKPDPHAEMPPRYMRPDAPPVGVVTEESVRAYEKGLRVAEKKAARTGVTVEHVRTQLPVIDN